MFLMGLNYFCQSHWEVKQMPLLMSAHKILIFWLSHLLAQIPALVTSHLKVLSCRWWLNFTGLWRLFFFSPQRLCACECPCLCVLSPYSHFFSLQIPPQGVVLCAASIHLACCRQFFFFFVHSFKMFLSCCKLPCIPMGEFTTVSGSIKDVITGMLPPAPCPSLSIILQWLYVSVIRLWTAMLWCFCVYNVQNHYALLSEAEKYKGSGGHIIIKIVLSIIKTLRCYVNSVLVVH